jgi:hypothetical protein
VKGLAINVLVEEMSDNDRHDGQICFLTSILHQKARGLSSSSSVEHSGNRCRTHADELEGWRLARFITFQVVDHDFRQQGEIFFYDSDARTQGFSGSRARIRASERAFGKDS